MVPHQISKITISMHGLTIVGLNSFCCCCPQTQRMLDEEQREDTAMKDRFKDNWKRTSSSKLTQSLRGDVSKFHNIVETATKADSTVKQKFESHRSAFVMLGKAEPDLEASLPKAGAQSAILSGSQVSKLACYFLLHHHYHPHYHPPSITITLYLHAECPGAATAHGGGTHYES